MGDLATWKELGRRALDVCRRGGAQWADVRLGTLESEDIAVRNGVVCTLEQEEQTGFGVRVLVDGAHGFASGFDLTPAEVERVAALAVEIARSGRMAGPGRLRWADEPAWRDVWTTPYVTDPFDVPVDRKLATLLAADAILRAKPEVSATHCSMSFRRETQLFLSSEGAEIAQTLLRSGGGISCTAHRGTESQTRSYPAAFGGQYMSVGYELIESLDLPGHAERTREEAIELLSADECPVGDRDVILSGDQLALQIHESVGHPTELDRVQGWEANFAGTSFADTAKLSDRFRYGSPIVNLVADATVPGGLATCGYDDDGVRSQRWHIVQEGQFTGYLTSRDVAHFEPQVPSPSRPEPGPARSRGCGRAEGAWNVPIVRISNLSLMPGSWSFDDLIADTEDGIYMAGVKCWSIDQLRLNFQFTCEYGWEIRNGRRTRTLRNPTYQGITPAFWNSCDAICTDRHWRLWGVPNCGKGQPMQIAEMSHGAAPARFRKVAVGVRG